MVTPPASDKTSATPSTPSQCLWTCTKNNNGSDGYTTYTFILQGSLGKFIFFGYDKNSIPTKSAVRAGFNWGKKWAYGTYEIKLDNGEVLTKEYGTTSYWSPTKGSVSNNHDSFGFSYQKGESARFCYNIFINNNMITIRHDNEIQKFQISGLKELILKQGLTMEEIDAAMSLEEF